jgi:hypothetical protein
VEVDPPTVTLRDTAANKVWLKQGLTTAEAETSSRRQWFVFKADRTDARTPVQVLPLNEPR